jgi:calcium-dependent protein kinase
MRAALREFDSDLGDAELAHIFHGMSVHSGHSINYNEFIAATMWRRIHLDEERVQEVFDKLDVTKEGFLTAQTIQNAVGTDFSASDVASMLAECDFDGDGRIDYVEFERLWKSFQVRGRRRRRRKKKRG